MMLSSGMSMVIARHSIKTVSTICPGEKVRLLESDFFSLVLPLLYQTPSPVTFLLTTCVSRTRIIPTTPLNRPTALAREYWPFWMPIR